MKSPAICAWRVAASLSGGALLLAVACNDAVVTSPTSSAQRAGVAPAHADDPGGGHPGDAQDELSFQLPAPNVYDGSSTLSGDLARYPHPTIVQATIGGGIVSYTPNYEGIGPPQGPFGPEGRIVLFYWDGGTTRRFDFATRSMYIPFVGAGELFTIARAGLGTLTLTGFRATLDSPFIFCGPIWGNPCFSYGGDAGSVTLRRLASVLQATPEKENAELNETPYIDYRANPMVVEGQNMPFVVDSTHWIPDPPALGGSPDEQPVHASGEGACQRIGDAGCRHRMKGSGTFKIDAWVNGKWFTRSVHISVGTEKVQITPIPDREPTITLPPGSACAAAMTFINQRNIRVHVTRSDGSPVAGRQVNLALGAYDDDGGHLKSGHAPNRPWGSVPAQVLTTDGNGDAVVLWTIPEFSGRIGIKADLVGVSGQSDSITVNVQIPGLTELPENASLYQRVGIIAGTHPKSHFGLAALIPEITKLATWAHTKNIPIGINDMSLPLGGRFDVAAKGAAGGQWMDSPHHCSHRNGNAFDFQTSTLSEAQRKRVLTHWYDVLKHSAYEEGDHDHLKLPPQKAP